AAHGEAVAIRTERQAVGLSADDVQGESLLPRPQVPDLYDQVIPGAGQSLVVGAKRQIGDFTRVGLQGSDLLQGLWLDDLDGPVLVPDGDQPTVPAERRPPTDCQGAGAELGDRPSGGQVPDLYEPFRVHGDDLLAARGEGQTPDHEQVVREANLGVAG